MSKVTINTFLNKKNTAEKITMLTAYDCPTAKLISDAGIDGILVGDSLGNVFAGESNTLSVTLEQIIYHSNAVSNAKPNSLIIGDLPFLSYEVSPEQARKSAGRLVKEGHVEAIKLEVNPKQLEHVEAIITMGIPVMAHIGFTPQSIHQLGGYKIQGKSDKDAEVLIDLAKKLEDIGAFSVLLEMVPSTVSQKITEALSIPVIGIGAGANCDGQILVTHDLLGISDGFKPKFVKSYANLHDTISSALSTYKKEVVNKDFPSDEHSF